MEKLIHKTLCIPNSTGKSAVVVIFLCCIVKCYLWGIIESSAKAHEKSVIAQV